MAEEPNAASVGDLIAYSGMLSQAARKALENSELQRQFINGAEHEYVKTDAGPVPTLKELARLSQVAAANSATVGLAGFGIYSSYEEGVAGTGKNGGFVVLNDGDSFSTGYVVRDGVVSAVGRVAGGETVDYVNFLKSILGVESDTEYALKIKDAFDSIGLGLRWSGQLEVNELVASSAISIAGLKITASNEDSDLAFTLSDDNNRPLFGVGWSGRLYILSMSVQESLSISDGSIKASSDSHFIHRITDRNGQVALGIGYSGKTYLRDLYVSGASLGAARNSEFIHCIADRNGQIAFGIGRSGKAYLRDLYVHDKVTARTINAENVLVDGRPVSELLTTVPSESYPKKRPLSGFNYINFNGQSQQEGAVSTVILSGHDSPVEGVYTARGNVKTRHLGDDVSAAEWDMVGLHETVNGRNAETPATSAGLAVKSFYPDDIDKTFKLYILNSSVGGRRVGQWQGENSSLWRYFKNSFDSAVRHANALGMRLNVPIWNWWQGGSDEGAGTSKSAYLSAWYDLYNRFKQLIADHRGVPVEYIELPVFIVQTNNYANYPKGTGGVSEAHLQIANDLDDAVICPSYMLTPAVKSNYQIVGDKLVPQDGATYDAVHNDNISYARMGIYAAIALRERVVNGDASFKGVKPKHYSVNGKYIAIEFHTTYGALQFWDGPRAAPITDVENNGFSAIDKDGNQIPLTSVVIANDTTVVISIAREWERTDTIQYAVIGNAGRGSNKYGRFGYGRGKLWDHGADRGDIYDVGGETFEFNWPCVQFWKKVEDF
ncbi:hypothetical protein R84981_001697 [Carnimonas sp. R-84981]|uniref:hypothetical protein n=1 Tax=Carnimonas bestiolae TaxID=3402172 RepID=UPI003EDCA282